MKKTTPMFSVGQKLALKPEHAVTQRRWIRANLATTASLLLDTELTVAEVEVRRIRTLGTWSVLIRFDQVTEEMCEPFVSGTHYFPESWLQAA